MTTSQTPFLSEPVAGKRISLDTFYYWRARAKREAYDLVLSEFLKSGMTKTELANRLGKTLPEVSRMLGGPANWTIATVSDLLFAIAGGIPKWGITIPRRARRNDSRPRWLDSQDTPLTKRRAPPQETKVRQNDLGLGKPVPKAASKDQRPPPDYAEQLGHS